MFPAESVNITSNEDSYEPTPLSETGAYAFSVITATALAQLFPEDYNKDFCNIYLNTTLSHINASAHVRKAAHHVIMEYDPNCHILDPYIIILTGPSPQENYPPNDIISRLLTVAVRENVPEGYDSRSRVLIKHLIIQLRLSVDVLESLETFLVQHLRELQPDQNVTNETTIRSKLRERKRFLMIGLAAVGGGAIIGLTGGLAAPMIAAGVGTVIGTTATVTAIGSVAGAAILGSLFGVAGAGLTGYRMNNRVGALDEFQFLPLSDSRQLSLTIAIAGYIKKDVNDFMVPWRYLAHSEEQYCLRWESDRILEMGNAIDYFMSGAKVSAVQETLKYTLLSGIVTAIAWPAVLLTASSVIDNPWSVGVNRAADAGKVLADLLLARQQGSRPVTLIGFSLGARLIFYCLRELATREGSEGIIEDVFLFGAPVTGNPRDWEKFQRVVAGTILNGYCRSDWLLKFLFRFSNVAINIAGLTPVLWTNRRMHNFDLSDVVTGHGDYFNKMTDILQIVGVRTLDPPSASTNSIIIKKVSSSPSIKSDRSSNGNQSLFVQPTFATDCSNEEHPFSEVLLTRLESSEVDQSDCLQPCSDSSEINQLQPVTFSEINQSGALKPFSDVLEINQSHLLEPFTASSEINQTGILHPLIALSEINQTGILHPLIALSEINQSQSVQLSVTSDYPKEEQSIKDILQPCSDSIEINQLQSCTTFLEFNQSDSFQLRLDSLEINQLQPCTTLSEMNLSDSLQPCPGSLEINQLQPCTAFSEMNLSDSLKPCPGSLEINQLQPCTTFSEMNLSDSLKPCPGSLEINQLQPCTTFSEMNQSDNLQHSTDSSEINQLQPCTTLSEMNQSDSLQSCSNALEINQLESCTTFLEINLSDSLPPCPDSLEINQLQPGTLFSEINQLQYCATVLEVDQSDSLQPCSDSSEINQLQQGTMFSEINQLQQGTMFSEINQLQQGTMFSEINQSGALKPFSDVLEINQSHSLEPFTASSEIDQSDILQPFVELPEINQSQSVQLSVISDYSKEEQPITDISQTCIVSTEIKQSERLQPCSHLLEINQSDNLQVLSDSLEINQSQHCATVSESLEHSTDSLEIKQLDYFPTCTTSSEINQSYSLSQL